MRRVVSRVTVLNPLNPSARLTFTGLVDTGAAYLTLPSAWKSQIGPFTSVQRIEFETATQQVVSAEVCGPAQIALEGFRPIYTEVVFLDMQPADGGYEPLVGYLPLEQSQAAVDMTGHRLVHTRHVDLK